MSDPIVRVEDFETGEMIILPARYEVCDRCRGTGVHDHPAFENGITSSEWAEWDDDERQAYRRGRYDVPCSECKGNRVVGIPLVERMTDNQKRVWKEHLEAKAEEAAERRMRSRGMQF